MPCFPGENPWDLLDARAMMGGLTLVSTLSMVSRHVINHADPNYTFFVGSVCVYMAYYALDAVLQRYSPRYQVGIMSWAQSWSVGLGG